MPRAIVHTKAFTSFPTVLKLFTLKCNELVRIQMPKG